MAPPPPAAISLLPSVEQATVSHSPLVGAPVAIDQFAPELVEIAIGPAGLAPPAVFATATKTEPSAEVVTESQFSLGTPANGGL